MGGRLADLAFKTRNFQPGPGTHSPRTHDGSPKTRFGSGAKCTLEGEKEFRQKPGPGAYTQKWSTLQSSSPRYGFGSGTRDETKLKLAVPGPGTYKPKTIIGADGPAKTMAGTLAWAPAAKE